MSKDDILCRNLLVLALCSAALGAGFFCWGEVKKTGGQEEEKVLVYELGWPDTEGGREVFRRERYFLDEETGQPWKIEEYLSDDPNGEYVLEETKIIDKSADEQEQGSIEDVNE